MGVCLISQLSDD